MQILTLEEALPYWSHPSQQVMGLELEQLPAPDDHFQYYADGPIAVLVHKSFWPDVFMFHIGVKPEGWGNLREHANRLIRDVYEWTGAIRLTTWVDAANRATVAMAKRHKFDLDGIMQTDTYTVHMFGISRNTIYA